ncbi:hypothetical protein T03_11558 [Trichinella britovi]|uniref:Uncharacterized protein n=1 Tax=Trichinella britovi TaxID=45882 RepID=A0A0V1CC60_TRIBR|nr:hypothetical protein T03_11558 [Trichinella britovi]
MSRNCTDAMEMIFWAKVVLKGGPGTRSLEGLLSPNV